VDNWIHKESDFLYFVPRSNPKPPWQAVEVSRFLLMVGLTMACGACLESRPAPVIHDVGPAEATATTMGTAHMLFVEGSSYRYRWAAICQARHDSNGDGWIAAGDAFRSFWVSADGAEIAMDAFLGSSPSKRFAAFERNGSLLVVDAKTARLLDLGPIGHQPPVAFDHYDRIAFARDLEGQSDVILVDLLTRSSQVLHRTRQQVRTLYFSGRDVGASVDERLEASLWDRAEKSRREPPCTIPDRPPICGTMFKSKRRPSRVRWHTDLARAWTRGEELDYTWPGPMPRNSGEPPPIAVSGDGGRLMALGKPADKDALLWYGPIEWQPIPEEPHATSTR
jgi:hypothetical protein